MSEKINASLIPDNAITEISGKIYDDVAHKSLAQIGDMSESLMKLVFLPFKCLGMTVDELEKKYKSFIEKTINKVPQSKLIAPDVIIASQILEHVKYVFTEDVLVEMFSNLLASDMNIDSKNEIHPSFVASLCQMSSFDAKVLLFLCVRPCIFESTLHFHISNYNNSSEQAIYRDISMIIPDIDQWNLSSNILISMGIIKTIENKSIYYKKFRKALKNYGGNFKIPKIVRNLFDIKTKNDSDKLSPFFRYIIIILNDNFKTFLHSLKSKTINMNFFYVQCKMYCLTDYGHQLTERCISTELKESAPECKITSLFESPKK